MITSAEEFIRLWTSENPEEYLRAAHEPAPEEVWLTLIDNHPDMRVWVIRNKTVPLSILKRLIDDTDPWVRHAVAMKRKLSVEMFEMLAEDSHESVRKAIACNRKTPLNIIKRLSHDESLIVSEAANKRLKEVSS
jgi:hypothetical protein